MLFSAWNPDGKVFDRFLMEMTCCALFIAAGI
jgi:hypothetical protein